MNDTTLPTPAGYRPSDYFPSSGSQSEPPKVIGRYEIRELLGTGAFGRVYLAYDPHMERDVAVKTPIIDPESHREFQREGRIVARFRHQNICPVFDVGVHENLPYIVMYYATGGTLDQILKSRRPPPRETLRIIGQISQGLEYSHAQKVFHRDLKPANVLFDRGATHASQLLLTDFGVARAAGTVSLKSQALKGSPHYMAPEQWGEGSKFGNISAQTDIYSLGVLMFRALTGETPFQGGLYELMAHHCVTPPRRPSDVWPGLNPRIDDLCLKALAKQPADRYKSATAFTQAITDYLRNVPVDQDYKETRTSSPPNPKPSTTSADPTPAASPVPLPPIPPPPTVPVQPTPALVVPEPAAPNDSPTPAGFWGRLFGTKEKPPATTSPGPVPAVPVFTTPQPSGPTPTFRMQFDAYDIVDKIAEGGMGTVYKARYRDTGAIVALKVITPSVAKNPVLLQRFEREFMAAKALNHPNVVKALGFIATPQPFLVMEYVDGLSIGQRIEQRGAYPEAEALRLIGQVCDGLQQAHKQGVVHRNVKPDKILVTREGVAKLTDMGLVKEVEGDMNLTRTGRPLGTPHYMAPEQFRNAKTVDVRGDIYSLSATLYAMVTGVVPFDNASPLDCWMKKIRQEFPTPKELNPTLSDRVDWAIRRAMSAEPGQRPSSCREFLEDLTGQTRSVPVGAPPAPVAVVGDVWYLVYRDQNNQPHTVKGSTDGIRKALLDRLLGDPSGIVVSRKKNGEFVPLSSTPEFRDLVVKP